MTIEAEAYHVLVEAAVRDLVRATDELRQALVGIAGAVELSAAPWGPRWSLERAAQLLKEVNGVLRAAAAARGARPPKPPTCPSCGMCVPDSGDITEGGTCFWCDPPAAEVAS